MWGRFRTFKKAQEKPYLFDCPDCKKGKDKCIYSIEDDIFCCLCCGKKGSMLELNRENNKKE